MTARPEAPPIRLAELLAGLSLVTDLARGRPAEAATSHEYAAAFGGDDVRFRGEGDLVDPTVPREGLRFLWSLTTGSGLRRLADTAGTRRIGTRSGLRRAIRPSRPATWPP